MSGHAFVYTQTVSVFPCHVNSLLQSARLKLLVFFKYDVDEIGGEIELKSESESKYGFYIAEEKLHECPRILVRVGGEEVSAILDTGCELTLMNEDLYEKIKQKGKNYLELPAQYLTLVSAFND